MNKLLAYFLHLIFIKVDLLTWLNKLGTFQNQIPKNLSRVSMKWNLLEMKFTGFYKKQSVYLFKTKKVWNVIYCQCFLKPFENRNGKLLRFFRSRHLRSSVKKGILEISQNWQGNTCVIVSILINLHASEQQLYQKRDSNTGVFL